MRDLSLAESGQLKLELKPVHFPDLLRRKISQIEVAARAKGIRLEFKSPDVVPEVLVDVIRMEQVVSNLLTTPSATHLAEGRSLLLSLSKKKTDLTVC